MKKILNGVELKICEKTGTMAFGSGSFWAQQYPLREDYSISDLKETEKGFSYKIKRPEFSVFANCDLEIEKDGLITLTVKGEGSLPCDFHYPQSFIREPEAEVLYPICGGVMFKANDKEAVIPQRLALSGGNGLSMGFLGSISNGNWFLNAVMTSADGAVATSRDDNELVRSDIIWIAEKGNWGYERKIRFMWGEGGITELCLAYREIAKEKGFIVPFTEKVKKVSKVDKMLGAADIWIWNSDAMEMLYSKEPVYRVPSKEQVERRISIAKEMKQMGMDNVLWSIFNENIESEEISAVNDLGFITTFYDIYTDVIPKDIFHLIPETRQRRCEQRIGYWPDAVIKNKDGSYCKAWALMGTDGVFHDQHRICDAVAPECAKPIVEKRKVDYGMEGCFLDVMACTAFECYSEEHPNTRREAMVHKRRLADTVTDMDLICGTEIGCEDVAATIHYNEGMMSPPPYRAYDSGRRMTHLYYGEDVPENIKKYMLNPACRVPLWEMVFHGSVQSYFYWGDSQNCCPELIANRDRLCALYGVPPIYSLCETDWETLKDDIKASYERTVPVAKKVGYATLDSFEYLTKDRLVQRTKFSNGVTITVNFSDETYTDGEITLLPKETLVK